MKFFRYVVLLVLASLATVGQAGLLKEVPLPSVPSHLRQPQERANYIIEHFWDNTDSLGSYTREAVEQAFSNFISVFPIADESARANAAQALIRKVEKNPAEAALVAEIADIYLYRIDSPIESEEYYILFLNEIVNSPYISDEDKIRPRWQLEGALHNRPGSVVCDFPFETRDGRKTSLHSELSPEKTLLIIYDPDCGHCNKVMKRLAANNGLSEAVARGEMKIIAIYSGDEKDLWTASAYKLPADWTVGYEDGTIQEDNLYVIRSLPALYVIGADKKVVLKDATEDEMR